MGMGAGGGGEVKQDYRKCGDCKHFQTIGSYGHCLKGVAPRFRHKRKKECLCGYFEPLNTLRDGY